MTTNMELLAHHVEHWARNEDWTIPTIARLKH